jgi:hypothetical protein
VLQDQERARRTVAAASGRRRAWRPRVGLWQRRGGVARAEESQRREARAATVLEMTRGSYPSRKWHRQSCSGGERWRPVMAERGQLGRTAERHGVRGEGQ